MYSGKMMNIFIKKKSVYNDVRHKHLSHWIDCSRILHEYFRVVQEIHTDGSLNYVQDHDCLKYTLHISLDTRSV